MKIVIPISLASALLFQTVLPGELPLEERLLNLLIQVPTSVALIFLLWKVFGLMSNQTQLVSAAIGELGKQGARIDRIEANEQKQEAERMEVMRQHTAALNALVGSDQAVTAGLSQQVTVSQQNQAILTQIAATLETFRKQMDGMEKTIGGLQFPQMSEFKTEFDAIKTSVSNAAKRCEEAKKGTGEHAIIPDITPPAEDADALPPGADAQENAAA